ncbi:hypothetical protein C2I18_14910 [Paenibacillus sp. PK3_47]|uniref:phosphotransferase family protein n=1 Tax=Paenibacillus sp. PK3_47 TaxID=2072642 RepID=UPI00201DED45|nr:aminoglycoside phosphotransferase family protein [Paenibacillus sp. PK3_47]UQZ34700.1 hypothetical protein C2I18_14910 [Paenibacillus sp. PK3_47]
MQGKRIGEGRTAEVWEYGEGAILKLYREDIPGEHVDREYTISSYAYAQGVHTPRPLDLITVEGRKGIVFEHIAGKTMLRMIGEQPWQTGDFARQLAVQHYSLHRHAGPDGEGRQKSLLRQQIIAAPMLTMEEKSAVLDHLVKLPEGDCLCHGDFHPDNVLGDGAGWIIDWMTGISGSPAADTARSVILLSMGSMPPGTPFLTRLITSFIRQKLCKGYIREYLKLSGQSYADITAWVLPVAAARLIEGVPLAEKEQLAREVRRRLRSAGFRT